MVCHFLLQDLAELSLKNLTSLVYQTREEFTCYTGEPGSIPGWEDPLEKGMATHSSVLETKKINPTTTKAKNTQGKK